MILSFVPAVLLLVFAARADSVSRTFEDKDPTSGLTVTCDRCSPGTYLRSPCSSTKKSECAPCPPGSFTEVWNHIGRCLRCGVCSNNQVVKTPCTSDRDCECQCKPGHYYNEEYEMCIQHSECPSGQGAVTKGTPDQNTVCQICPGGTYSDVFSARHNCTVHRSCSNAGLQLVLEGSTWHNSVCANCNELKDGADYLREILPAFFVHHNLNVKRLRRIVHKLSSKDGKKQGRTSDLNSSELHEQLNTWIVTARPDHIRELSSVLVKSGASGASERLGCKLRNIDVHLNSQCRGNEVEMV